MRVPGARVPYSLIVLYDSQMWTRAGWLRDGIQNKQEEKWEKNPAEHQTDVFAYSKVRSKYGVTGIAVSLTVALEVIFLGTHKAIVKRTSQVASVPKKMGYTGSQWEAEWLTHDNCSSNHCAFVLLLTTNSRLTLLGFYSCCLCHTMTSFTLSESERQREKKKQASNLECFFGSQQALYAACRSIFLAVCVNVQKSGQIFRQMCPVVTPLSSFCF